MNLYSIYDSETGLCLGKNKTVEQISNLFGVPQGGVYRAAMRGHILSGKYRVELSGQGVKEKEDSKKAEMMREWEETVKPLREYFKLARQEKEAAQ